MSPDADDDTPDTSAGTDVRARLIARVAAPEPAARFQVSVPDQWLPHLHELDRAIAALDPDYRVAQVKEKFGRLRFYLERAGRTEEQAAQIRALVRAAEHDSYAWS